MVFKTNAETAATLHASGGGAPFVSSLIARVLDSDYLSLNKRQANGTNNPVQSAINSAIAYSNITDLLGDYASQFKADIVANFSANANNRAFNPSADPTVTAGYTALQQANANMLLTQAGQVELLLALTGTAQGGPGR